jgi:outer membrane protein assembly factor BamB
MNTRLLWLTVVVPALLLPAVPAAERSDWPQFRGPDRSDVSQETGLLKEWPAGGPKLLWTNEDGGTALSGPAVVGDRLYAMGATDQNEYVFCLDVTTGKKVWLTEFGPRFSNDWIDGPRGTPTVDGTRLYALGGDGNLVCLDAAGGKKVWEKNLRTDLGGSVGGWGYCESPLVDGKRVVVTPGGKGGAVAALDKASGEVVWRSTGFTDNAEYSSLVIGQAGGIKQYVQMTGSSLAGVAADDGRLLWRFACTNSTAAIPTPVVDGDLVYSTSGYGAGCRLVKITRDGDGKEKAEQVYATEDMTNHHGGVVRVGDYVYGYSDSKGAWVCQDFKTGKVVWPNNATDAPPEQKQTTQKLGKGSLTCADGMLYLYAEKDGTCALIEASPAGWKEHGRFKLPRRSQLDRQRSQVWTHPVVANGRLYLRDLDLIFAFDVRGRNGAQ